MRHLPPRKEERPVVIFARQFSSTVSSFKRVVPLEVLKIAPIYFEYSRNVKMRSDRILNLRKFKNLEKFRKFLNYSRREMLCKINQKFTYLALAPPFSNATVGFWSVGEKDSKQRIIYIQFTYHSLERNTKKDKKKERITPTTTLKKEKEKERNFSKGKCNLSWHSCIVSHVYTKIIYIKLFLYI